MPEFDQMVIGLLVVILIVLLYLVMKVEKICDILHKRDNYDITPTPATYYEYTSATAAPKANSIAMDGMTGGAGTYPWQGMYAQTSYPKSTGTSKDGMTPAPGYYAGNLNAGGGPPKIGPESLIHSVESSVPVAI